MSKLPPIVVILKLVPFCTAGLTTCSFSCPQPESPLSKAKNANRSCAGGLKAWEPSVFDLKNAAI